MRSYPGAIGLGTGTPAPPAAPAITLAAGTGQVVVTIAGDAGATHWLKYKGSSHTSWQDGGSRSGDGDITVTGISNNVPYIFVAYSQVNSGPFSTPSVAAILTLAAASESTDFCQMIGNDADIILSEFGETIVYKPRGGGSRSIEAVVTRAGAEGLGGAPAGNAPLSNILVKNDSTEGISSSEIDTGGDKVTIAHRIGDTAQDRRITNIIGQDCGMMTLEVR